ncbi:hypothetical protein [Helicobacter labacensis]|uniref:hypothetical protein n=1 Tax=Helicobacter labacensis TaxID=2316079 RepID=UPI000EB0A791|nr:hypothetical protein [Helicobacter labacensis]
MPAIKILADATPQSGLGHLRRAQKLKGHLANLGFSAQVLAPHPLADQNLDWLRALEIAPHDVLFIDSYLAPLDFYHHAHAHARTVVVLEDSPHANLPPKTFIINPSYQAEQLYTQIKPRMFLGCAFMPFEKAFKLDHKPLKPNPTTLLMCFGGSAQSLPFYQQALEILDKGPLHVQVIAPPQLALALPKTSACVHTHLDLFEIASLMHASDIALLGGGGMLYEAMLALSSILALPIAPNQLHQLAALSGVHACLSSSLDTLSSDLAQFGLATRARMQVAQKALNIGSALQSTLQAILLG